MYGLGGRKQIDHAAASTGRETHAAAMEVEHTSFFEGSLLTSLDELQNSPPRNGLLRENTKVPTKQPHGLGM